MIEVHIAAGFKIENNDDPMMRPIFDVLLLESFFVGTTKKENVSGRVEFNRAYTTVVVLRCRYFCRFDVNRHIVIFDKIKVLSSRYFYEL